VPASNRVVWHPQFFVCHFAKTFDRFKSMKVRLLRINQQHQLFKSKFSVRDFQYSHELDKLAPVDDALKA
jgi:hypothetical protein